MNQESAKKLANWLGAGLGGYLLGWASSRGYQWGDIINQLLSSEVFLGLMASVITLVYTWLSGRAPWLVSAVNNLSGVKGVITENNVEGLQLASDVPAASVVPAGTSQAVEMAKSV